MKCVLCGKEISEKESNNAQPLAEGRCCNDCNWRVIKERLKLANKKAAEESVEPTLGELDGVVVGGGGPVNITNPMADFEKYAKEFEETFVLGKTPVHKEEAKNKTKVKDGEIVGSIDSMAKDEKVEQVDPLDENKNTKSANESLADARPNHTRLLEIVLSDEGKIKLAEELLNWMSDDEIGEFMVANGYED